ncbi:hypothetical protein J2W14_003145 [Pseudarthrobacter oxydans]|uniref:hypothetical protein n=1 Tax=Pseudarthrobacter oxydans TaxID=1671 RepID=UPI002783EC10|nr:hypothetical protein [Pseudarthrobacter oxydans]MDP9983722.1 hypothetical protein [Pseudarthrobacter oxydans]
MVHGGNVPKRRAVIAAGIGSAALAAYSIAGAFQTLVWNPLAAVPGATLGEIYAALDDADESLGAPRVIAWSVVGVALAAVALIAAILAKAPRASCVIAGYLALIVLAAPSHWFVAFTGGMGIADAFATSGGDHAPWGGLLYTASGLALLALVGMAVQGKWLRSA